MVHKNGAIPSLTHYKRRYIASLRCGRMIDSRFYLPLVEGGRLGISLERDTLMHILCNCCGTDVDSV